MTMASTEHIVQMTNDEDKNVFKASKSNSTLSVDNTPKESEYEAKTKTSMNWSKIFRHAALGVLWLHFAFATYYFITTTEVPLLETTCSGYGFLLMIFFALNWIVLAKFIRIPIIIKSILWQISQKRYFALAIHCIIVASVLIFIMYDTWADRKRLIPFSGLVIFVAMGYVCSNRRDKIRWDTVSSGILLQFLFGIVTVRWPTGRAIFDCMGHKINTFLQYAFGGATFVYGDALINQYGVFAFKVLSTIYFLSFMINILYYYGIMQKVVVSMAKVLQWTMKTSICESVNSAANIFLGMSEAPLLLKPYLHQLTESELNSVMTSGFATISGTAMAAYISFGANPAHLVTASVMSAPAALCFSKLMHPETESVLATKENIIHTPNQYQSVLDAASQGAQDALKMVLGITSNLIAFIAFVFFINAVLAWLGALVGFTDPSQQWSVELFFGKIFTPLSFTLGVPWSECEAVGELIGIKTMVNEFVAFEKMSTMNLTARSKIIATYAICGFSNPGSMGIMVSALSTLIPEKRDSITKLVLRSFFAGVLVCLMTACVAAILVPSE